MALHFAPSETTEAYMHTLSDYLDAHGRPLAFYSDRHSIFRVNTPGKQHNLTQFTRALKAFDIEPIHASTPQAKGRVERANQTLQDRLVKAMRLRGISSIDQANRFLPEFIKDYNRRFAVKPRSKVNLHRQLHHGHQEKKAILSLHNTCKLDKNLMISYKGMTIQLTGYGKGYRLRHKTVTVCEHFDGEIKPYHDGKALTYRYLERQQKVPSIANQKEIEAIMTKTKHRKSTYKPALNHPWRRYANNSKTAPAST